jgi:DNA-directed RNA polymerase specialized sigma subunit
MGKYYINNDEFEDLILLYKEDPDSHEEELVKIFDILITNILTSFKFKVDRDDAKQECFSLVLKIIKNFKPTKGTAFNYFTTIIVNNLKLIYTKNKKYNKKIEDLFDLKRDYL